MSPEILRTELARTEDAVLHSDEQVRELVAMIDKSKSPEATLSASDCHKLVTSTLALNARLREQATLLKNAVRAAQRDADEAARGE